jgi:hypothetical protein
MIPYGGAGNRKEIALVRMGDGGARHAAIAAL